MTTESTRRADPLEKRCRELAMADGKNPDDRVEKSGDSKGRGQPLWCTYRAQAREEQNKAEADLLGAGIATLRQQPEQYRNSPLLVMGAHEESTVTQMRNCMAVGNAAAGVICADGHLGYAQPVGGVIAYQDQISISGVGFDIGCGNCAIRLDTKYGQIKDRIGDITREIAKTISFGVGRTNDERVDHALFDDLELWHASGMNDYKNKARSQLGTVGSGNHYVDVFREVSDDNGGSTVDDDMPVWIGVHFGSRGLGHTSATRYLKAAGGTDGMNVPPTVIDVGSGIGEQYLAAMNLAGQYAYAGRDWVIERVRQIIGGEQTYYVHNHHNYAWVETHNGQSYWVVRKGATPAFPGQSGFVGGSMGDDAVILEGVDSETSRSALYSTIHGAGRLFGRRQALRTFTHEQMNEWLLRRGVTVIGGDLDESPMAYRRLPEVLAYHQDTVKINHRLRPVGVVMAGRGEVDPFKD